MATPNVGILTTTGKALIDKVNSGQAKISFSKVVFSSMDNSQLSDTQIKALTAIAPQEVVVSSPQTTLDTNSGETRIRATGTNEKLADGVYVKTYGVFAKDDTGNEILYGVTVSPNPNYFPAYDGVTPQAVTYSYKTVIQETSNITMTNSNDVYVSQEDLTEAIAKIPQPDLSGYDKTDDVDKKLQNKQDKLGYTAANDSKVVHDNGDGTIQVNGTQVSPYNKLTDSVGGRNLLPVSNYNPGYVNGADGTISSANGATKEVISNFIPVDATQNYYCQIVQQVNANQAWYGIGFYDANEQYISRHTSGKIVTGTITSVIRMLPFGSHNISIPNVSTIDFPTNTAYVRISFRTYGAPIQASLEKTSILNDWTPAPEDKVSVSDMRKPANDVAGIEEVNAKQDKLTITPADDSKVAHLSGANNFDTTPTVNNNPLLLASSLPSDLARTSQQTNFTAGLQSGGVNVATAADLKSIEDSAWRELDTKYLTLSSGTLHYNTHILYKIDSANKMIWLEGGVAVIGSEVSVTISFSGIAKNVTYLSGYQLQIYTGNETGNGTGMHGAGPIVNNSITLVTGNYPGVNSLCISSLGTPYLYYDELV